MSEQKLTVFIAIGIFELILLIVLLLVVRSQKRRAAEPPIMTVEEFIGFVERQQRGQIPGTPEFEARIAALDEEDPQFAAAVRADAERKYGHG